MGLPLSEIGGWFKAVVIFWLRARLSSSRRSCQKPKLINTINTSTTNKCLINQRPATNLCIIITIFWILVKNVSAGIIICSSRMTNLSKCPAKKLNGIFEVASLKLYNVPLPEGEPTDTFSVLVGRVILCSFWADVVSCQKIGTKSLFQNISSSMG